MTTGSHPPCAIFRTFAPKNTRSIDRNTPVTSSAAGKGQCQRSTATTCSKTAVMTIVSVTAMPYAAANAVDEPKPMTIAMVLTISAQFTCGT
jgi:hypothetical protein